MKKKSKKYLSLFLAVVMVFYVIPFSVLRVSAETSGVYEYSILSETDKTCEITGFTGHDSAIVLNGLNIPSEIDGYTVTSIGSNAFCIQGTSYLTSVTIPGSVTSIGNSAFYGCQFLKSITIPDSVTSISDNAFGNTAYYNDESNWENDVLYIGNCLIKARDTVGGDYIIKDGTRLIADDAFYDCLSLTSVVLPECVTSIGRNAFYNCSSLTNIVIPDSMKYIGDCAFENTGITEITLPENTYCDDGSPIVKTFPFCSVTFFHTSREEIDYYGHKITENTSAGIDVEWGTTFSLPIITQQLPEQVTNLTAARFGMFRFTAKRPNITLEFPQNPNTYMNLFLYDYDTGDVIELETYFNYIDGNNWLICEMENLKPDAKYAVAVQLTDDNETKLVNVSMIDKLDAIDEKINVTENNSITLPTLEYDKTYGLYFTPDISDFYYLDNISGGVLYNAETGEKIASDKYGYPVQAGTEYVFIVEVPGYWTEQSCTVRRLKVQNDFYYWIRSGEANILEYTGNDAVPVVPSEIEGFTVSNIGETAFKDKLFITGIVLPEGITSMGMNTTEMFFEDMFAGCDSFSTIYGHKGSYAEKYAANYGYNFISIDTSPSIVQYSKSQIRFHGVDANKDFSNYQGVFDVRTVATISQTDFTNTFGTEEEALKNISDIGFVYAAQKNMEAFDIDTAKAVVEGTGTDENYIKKPVSYIQHESDGADYIFTCLITDVPDIDREQAVYCYAYVCCNGEYYYFDDVTVMDFNSLYTTHMPKS